MHGQWNTNGVPFYTQWVHIVFCLAFITLLSRGECVYVSTHVCISEYLTVVCALHTSVQEWRSANWFVFCIRATIYYVMCVLVMRSLCLWASWAWLCVCLRTSIESYVCAFTHSLSRYVCVPHSHISLSVKRLTICASLSEYNRQSETDTHRHNALPYYFIFLRLRLISSTFSPPPQLN